MKKIWLDNETRSRIDLKKSNVYRYAEDPDFRILMCAWTVDKVNYHIAIGEDEVRAIPGLFDEDVIKVAANSAFERVTFSRLHGLPTGRYLRPEAFDDPMVRASESGYPNGLDKAAKALGTVQKDSAGTRLINLFSKPNRKGEWNDATTHPKEWQEFIDYCIQDVRTLVEIDELIAGWPPGEWEKWITDQYINDRGLPVDVPMAEGAVRIAARNATRARAELARLAPELLNPNSGPQMHAWLQTQGVTLPDLTADTLTAALEDDALPDTVRRVLELKQEIALVAAKKYPAALYQVCQDGRLRGSFKFYGAHTGRWSGKGVQPHNMPSASVGEKDDPFDVVEQKIQAGVIDLKLGSPTSPQQLKELVRAMFVGPFTVVDYAAIEARVIAWLAGEEWALKAFELGRDIYVETAERMGGLTRKEGKVAVLALGYQGGINSLKIMGAQGDDDHLDFLKNQWREANPSIVQLWYDVENAFMYGDRSAGDHLYVTKDGADRHIRLPSGRSLVYHDLRGRNEPTPWGTTRTKITFADPQGWRTDTYGGKLVENCLAGDTEVLTGRGWLPLVSVTERDQVWDGVEWVTHSGLLYSGTQQTLSVDGVRMTADHRLLTTEGWNSASSSEGSHRAAVQLPDGDRVRRVGRRPEVDVEGSLHLREGVREGGERAGQAEDQVLRVHEGRVDRRVAEDSRDDCAPRVCSVARDARPLQASNAPGVAQLRGPGDHGLRALGNLRGVLGGYGPDVREGPDNRASGQRGGVLAGELPVGHLPGAGQQQKVVSPDHDASRRDDNLRGEPGVRHRVHDSALPFEEWVPAGPVVLSAGFHEPVYDLMNAGPRSRFVVRGPDRNPIIVHNCTQAVARDILAEALVKLHRAQYEVVGHVHDEILVRGNDVDRVKSIMTEVPAWANGLPIAAEGFVCARYRKD